MHGGAAGSGAPSGSKNGNYKHGRYTQEVAATRRWLREATRLLRMMELSQRHLGEENIAVYGAYANKLIKLQNDLLQTLDRRRRGNSQSIVVKHVHIHPGAQGVVGIVNHDEGQKRGGDQN